MRALHVSIPAALAGALVAAATAAAEPTITILDTAPAPAVRAKPPAGALPDSHPGMGQNDIALAWLAEPTDRYDHAVLGDGIEAGALMVRTRDGRELRYALESDAVFEDLHARVIDLDGDGRDEVLVVASRRSVGAALMALGVRGSRLVPLAETPPIGIGHRWLNPIGAADLDGDGRLEVAVVLTPHIGGTLVVYGYGAGGFRERWRLSGFSNHALGSRMLGLSAFVDADGDGLPDTVVPANDRRTLRVVSFAGGTPRELGAVALPAAAAGDFLVDAGARTIIVPLADGRAARIVWR